MEIRGFPESAQNPIKAGSERRRMNPQRHQSGAPSWSAMLPWASVSHLQNGNKTSNPSARLLSSEGGNQGKILDTVPGTKSIL